MQWWIRQSLDVKEPKDPFSGLLFIGVDWKYIVQISGYLFWHVSGPTRSIPRDLHSVRDRYVPISYPSRFGPIESKLSMNMMYASSCENLVAFGLVDRELWSMQIRVFGRLFSSNRYTSYRLVRTDVEHALYFGSIWSSCRIDWVSPMHEPCSNRSVVCCSYLSVVCCLNRSVLALFVSIVLLCLYRSIRSSDFAWTWWIRTVPSWSVSYTHLTLPTTPYV